MNKIIFLDVDGPLIPGRMYYKPRMTKDGIFLWDPIAVDMINILCEKYDAKVVFNSTHNDSGHIAMQMHANYHKLNYTHDDCITKYPSNNLTRLGAIEEWISRNGEVPWIVFDDFKLDHQNHILVNYENGISINNFYTAMEKFSKRQHGGLIGFE